MLGDEGDAGLRRESGASGGISEECPRQASGPDRIRAEYGSVPDNDPWHQRCV